MPYSEFEDLMDSLCKAPRRVIYGIVSPSGVGATKSQGDTLWHMTFSLVAWSTPEGPVQRGKVLVRRDIEDGELVALREQLPVYGIVALEVGLIEDSAFQGLQALLHTVLPEAPRRADLSQIAEELQAPAITEDLQFGTFTLDRRVNWYEADTFWGAESIRLALIANHDHEAFPHDSLVHARALWNDQPQWDRNVRDYMVGELLDLKNSCWLEQDEPKLSAEEFLQRVSLESITVNSGGSFEFWYDDGDLFWGHSIMVSGSLDSGIDDAGIHG